MTFAQSAVQSASIYLLQLNMPVPHLLFGILSGLRGLLRLIKVVLTHLQYGAFISLEL